MGKKKHDDSNFMVSIYESQDEPGTFVFTFVPKVVRQGEEVGGAPKRLPQHIVWVRKKDDRLEFDWSPEGDDPGKAKRDMEREAEQRIQEREEWVRRVSDLVEKVEQWGKELGWATRRIEKKLEDGRVGKHVVPALLLQEGTCRVLLEPLGRSAPKAEGVVDLYLMPAYDDIASFYYYNKRWNLHYALPIGTEEPTRRGGLEGAPLTKETLARILEAMKEHAT